MKPGDLLVRLEAGELEAGLARREAWLAIAQACPGRAKGWCGQGGYAVAQAGAGGGQVPQLARVKAGATAEDIAMARPTCPRRSDVRDAQSAYDGVRGMSINADAAGELRAASGDASSTPWQGRNTTGWSRARPPEESGRRGGVAMAQALELDRVKAAVRPEVVAVGQARVDQAQAVVQQAQAALAAAILPHLSPAR